MSDRHELAAATVEDVVTEDVLGVYMLYEGAEGAPRYVGRTDQLQTALLDRVDDYGYFWADYMPNVTRAYEKQVELYHFNGEAEELDNEAHPERPHKNVKCRLCDGA
jgi:hypothetical protein